MFLVWFSFSSFVISDSIFEVNFGLISLSVFFGFYFGRLFGLSAYMAFVLLLGDPTPPSTLSYYLPLNA